MDEQNNKQARLKTVVCDHCGKELTVKMPPKPGRYKFTCPHCQNKVSFEVNAADGVEVKVLKSDILNDRVISRGLPKEMQHAEPVDSKQRPNASIPVLGIPIVPPGKGHYQIMEKAQVNTQYRFVCPGCSKDIVIMPRVAGKLMRVKCSKCGTQVVYSSMGEAAVPHQAAKPNVVPPPHPAPPQDDDDGPSTVLLSPGGGFGANAGRNAYKPPVHNPLPPARAAVPPPVAGVQVPPRIPAVGPGMPPPPPVGVPVPPMGPGVQPPAIGGAVPIVATEPKGMLTWKTGSFISRSQSHRLRPGRTTIGRFDPDLPSTVMITGDDEMSRQSVEISAVLRQGSYDYTYELRILRSTNKIFVNNRVVENGMTVLLNYGDTICMGKTVISFVKASEDAK
ncbi:MAG: FHA domain-containing protein [Muribaculaceae bacterium]|nr:FHA domain-containing protein [Muribaculaceae bacterium]